MIVFNNACKHPVSVSVNDAYSFAIAPYEKEALDITGSETLRISVSPANNSKIKTDVFHIVVEVLYVFCDVNELSEFTIRREKIRFSCNACYERLYLFSPNAECISEAFRPKDEEYLRNKFKKSQRLKFFLSGPFEDFLGLPLFLILIGIVLLFALGIKVAVVYFPFAYLFLVLFHYVVSSFFNRLTKLDEKKELNDYLNPQYIAQYYSSGNREPFVGKIETD